MNTINNIINIIALIYIVLPLFFLLAVIIFYIIGKRLTAEIWTKILDFGKWYIASVALVFLVKMLESTFTERETGIKEMQVYDKYAEIILKADNIEERWKLSQYFSAVTPTQRLKDRWIEYRDTIKREYTIYTVLKGKQNAIKVKDSLTKADYDSLTILGLKLDPYEKRLTANDINIGNGWVVLFTTDQNLDQAMYEAGNLKKAGISGVRMFVKNNSFMNVSNEFSLRAEAQSFLNKYKNVIRSDVRIIQLSSWCRNWVNNGSYFECK